MTKRTLLVGLDAACWDYLDPLLHAGRLPALKRLMDAGAWGTLHSTQPALTPTAWASIATGKNPGKHGVFGMMWRRPGTYEFSPVSAQSRIGTPFWKRLNDWGIRVGLVNVPFTHPPDPIDGFLVCGFGSPSSASDLTDPRDVLAWIEAQFGRYKPQVDSDLFTAGALPAEIFDAESTNQAQHVRIALDLADRYHVDILVINLMLLDHANHYMPHIDHVLQAVCQSDEHLAQLIQAFRPDNVLLLSDHGSRRVTGSFLLHNWLLDQGYCSQVPRAPSERSAALNWLLVKWLQETQGGFGLKEKVPRRLIRKVLPRLPARIASGIWNLIEKDIPHAHEYVRLSDQIDYSQTRVFPGSGPSELYFNLIDREPTGIVPQQDRLTLSAELATRLARLMDPETDQPLFSGVYSPEEVYSGPAVEYAPDLILDGFASRWNILEGYYDPISERLFDRYFIDNDRTFGWHSRDGIFVFAGQDFKAGPASCEAHVMDIPANLLYLYGVPIPEDYDGQVLSEVIEREFVEMHPIRRQPGDTASAHSFERVYSAEESEELITRLRMLGYTA